jgi:hypothetical protein
LAYTGPTAANELCITFQYGIVNHAGFSASDIENMVNNTLKTGLIIAATDVTIGILNTSFPNNNRLLRRKRWNPFIARNRQGLFERSWREHRLIVPLNYFQSHFPPGFVEQVLSGDDRRHLVSMPTQTGLTPSLAELTRRLVAYLDSVPPEIIQIIDNPFCPQQSSNNAKCAIVTSNVCVFLDAGDDRQEVQTALRTGMQQSINNGDFEAAIPEENRLP